MLKYEVVDLFCGAGGFSLGFLRAGFPVVCGVDHWAPALKTYARNFRHEVVDLDLSDVKEARRRLAVHRPNIVIGGSPCQSFSVAGRRDKTDPRGDLVLAFADLVVGLQPRYFVLENVRGFAQSPQHDTLLRRLRGRYGVTEAVIDAAYVGVPQRRPRLFVVGELGGTDGALAEHLKTPPDAKPTTVRDYLGDSLGIDSYYRCPRFGDKRCVFSVDEPSPTIRGSNRPITPARKEEGLRVLTSQERAAIQTFPPDFEWPWTSKHNMDVQIGNAVPPLLGEFVANALRRHIVASLRQSA